MLIIYRKRDRRVVGNSGTNSYCPEGPPFDLEVRNVIAVYGGSPSDYGEFRLHDKRDKEIVEAIMLGVEYELEFDAQGNPIGIKIAQK